MTITTSLLILFAYLGAVALGWVLGRRGKTAALDRPPAPPNFSAVDLSETETENATLALFDLDDLSGVNRTNDFDTGDRLLNEVDDVLRRALPPGSAMERLDSGRFLMWTPGGEIDAAVIIADRLRTLAGSVQVTGTRGTVTRPVSVGVIETGRSEVRSRAILRADVALAEAKRAGGNQTRALRAQPAPSLLPSREVISEAIRTRELEYHVQPIMHLRTRQAVGIESLLRWNRPDGSVLGPARFMDTLNRLPEAGVELFPDLAIEAATAFVHGPKPIYATFNITGAVLDGKDSVACAWLQALLRALPPEHLVLEVVETAIIVAPERAQDLIGRVRARGARVALDDFGTGLSNLERLRDYDVDILKVDRSFVTNLNGSGREEAILASLATLANSLDLDIIAEGVETEEQAQAILKAGINYGQGFHLGRPAPASDWATRLGRKG